MGHTGSIKRPVWHRNTKRPATGVLSARVALQQSSILSGRQREYRVDQLLVKRKSEKVAKWKAIWRINVNLRKMKGNPLIYEGDTRGQPRKNEVRTGGKRRTNQGKTRGNYWVFTVKIQLQRKKNGDGFLQFACEMVDGRGILRLQEHGLKGWYSRPFRPVSSISYEQRKNTTD